MTKMELRRKRKAVRDDMKGEGNRCSTTRLDEESSSGSASSKDRLRGRSCLRGGKIGLVNGG